MLFSIFISASVTSFVILMKFFILYFLDTIYYNFFNFELGSPNTWASPDHQDSLSATLHSFFANGVLTLIEDLLFSCDTTVHFFSKYLLKI